MSEIPDVVLKRQQELTDLGYVRVEKWSNHQTPFDHLVDVATRRYGTEHKTWKTHLWHEENSDVSYRIWWAADLENPGQRVRKDMPVAIKGTWVPYWTVQLAQAFVAYEAEVKDGHDYDRLDRTFNNMIKVLHEADAGNLEQLELFLLSEELRKEDD